MNKFEINGNTDKTGSIRIRLPTAPAHQGARLRTRDADKPGDKAASSRAFRRGASSRTRAIS